MKIRVNKPTARKMYYKGFNIYLVPCKVINSVATCVPHDYDWITPFAINIDTCGFTVNKFDRSVNFYEFYNCNSELGYYSHYYVDEDEYNLYIQGGGTYKC